MKTRRAFPPIALLVTTMVLLLTAALSKGVSATDSDASGAVVPLSSNSEGGFTICSAPAAPIPDIGRITDTITVPPAIGGPIADLDVYLNVPHTWVGDLDFTLEHLDTTTSSLFVDRPGVPATFFGCSGNDYDVTVNDDGPDGDIETQCDNSPAIHGNRVGGDPPGPLLSVFDHEAAEGIWQLTINDYGGGDIGVLQEWCLTFEIEPPFEEPDIFVHPLFVGHTQPANTVTTHTLAVSNTGTIDLTWTIAEDAGAPGPPCDTPEDIPWLAVTPAMGTTTPGLATPVAVTFDSTALAPGLFPAALCIASNDPDSGPGNGTGLVIVELELTVETPTDVSLAGLSGTTRQVLTPVQWAILLAAFLLLLRRWLRAL